MKKYKVLRVEWTDIAAYSTWRDKDEQQKCDSLLCTSCGIETRVKKGNLGLMQSISETNDRSGTLVIPRGNIKKIEVLSTFRV